MSWGEGIMLKKVKFMTLEVSILLVVEVVFSWFEQDHSVTVFKQEKALKMQRTIALIYSDHSPYPCREERGPVWRLCCCPCPSREALWVPGARGLPGDERPLRLPQPPPQPLCPRHEPRHRCVLDAQQSFPGVPQQISSFLIFFSNLLYFAVKTLYSFKSVGKVTSVWSNDARLRAVTWARVTFLQTVSHYRGNCQHLLPYIFVLTFFGMIFFCTKNKGFPLSFLLNNVRILNLIIVQRLAHVYTLK